MADNSTKIAKLTELLQSGQIDQDMFDTNLAKLQTVNQNLRPDMPTRANSLSSVMDQIRSRGAGVQNVADEVKSATPGMSALGGRRAVLESVGDIAESIPKPTTTSLERLNAPKSAGRFGKTLKALGILGPAVGAMAMGDKAMAGDFGGAAMEGADLATDYIPVVGEVKQAIEPEMLGNAELPEEIMKARSLYNEQARRGKGGEPTRHPSFKNEELLGKPDPTRLEELQQTIRPVTRQFRNISPDEYASELKTDLDNLNQKITEEENSTLINAIDPYANMRIKMLKEKRDSLQKSYDVNSNKDNFTNATPLDFSDEYPIEEGPSTLGKRFNVLNKMK